MYARNNVRPQLHNIDQDKVRRRAMHLICYLIIPLLTDADFVLAVDAVVAM